MRRGLLRLGMAGLAALFAAACTTVTTESFRVVQDSQVESAFIAADADFSQYDTLNAEEMGIFFPRESAPSAEDIQRLRQIFREAFRSRLGNYRVVQQQPGPRTMTVQATLIDLRESSGGGLMDMRSDLRDMAQPGSLVFLMEMRDSETSRTLARAADSAAAPVISGTETDWDSVEEAADRWAELFVSFLDQNLGPTR